MPVPSGFIRADRLAVEPGDGTSTSTATPTATTCSSYPETRSRSLVASGRLDARLFDISLLLELDYDDAHRDRLPLIIVQPQNIRSTASFPADVARVLPSIGAVAVQVSKDRATEMWSELIGSATARAGGEYTFSKFWLDGRRELATGTIRLFRDGELVGERGDPSSALFFVPPEPANYRLELDSLRGEGALSSTEVHVAWAFSSAEVASGQPEPLPLFAVRFLPHLDDFNRARGDRYFAIPIEISRQPGGTIAPLEDLDVEASYDGGATWHNAFAQHFGDAGIALVDHPPAPGTVSLRAIASDADGNFVEQTILAAYHLR